MIFHLDNPWHTSQQSTIFKRICSLRAKSALPIESTKAANPKKKKAANEAATALETQAAVKEAESSPRDKTEAKKPNYIALTSFF